MSATEFRIDSEHAKRLIAMGQMAASMAHEIRNPLGSMELFCSLLKKDLANHPDALCLAEQIHSSIRTLDRIIENCLQFAREVSARKKTLPSAQRLIEEVLTNAEGPRQQIDVSITLSAPADGPIYVDGYLVKQALLNLIINAIESTQGITDARRIIIVSNVERNGSWDLSIADNGAGISNAEREKIFDPFFTTKQEGTGLGLAIVHSIITAHGATLSLESDLGVGTIVRINFPSHQVMHKEQTSCTTDLTFS